MCFPTWGVPFKIYSEWSTPLHRVKHMSSDGQSKKLLGIITGRITFNFQERLIELMRKLESGKPHLITQDGMDR